MTSQPFWLELELTSFPAESQAMTSPPQAPPEDVALEGLTHRINVNGQKESVFEVDQLRASVQSAVNDAIADLGLSTKSRESACARRLP